MANKMGLTATVIVEAQSLNYDEGYGNLSVLKKLRRASGEVFTYASRQSLRYSIVKQGNEQFGWKLAPVQPQGTGEKRVVQFTEGANIKDSEEIDFFGYMKTAKGNKTLTRVAPVRTTPLIALEPFFSDIEFLNNKWLADRAKVDPNLANIEQHRALYKYTITIDLDRIGNEEWNEILPEELQKVEVDSSQRSQRVIELLEVIKTLYRDIRGRREDLKPLFIVGGVYEIKNPFFMNVVKVRWEKNEPLIMIEPLQQIINAQYQYKENGKLQTLDMKGKTVVGARKDFWKNYDTLSPLMDKGSHNQQKQEGKKTYSPEEAIDQLELKVNAYYRVNNEG